MTLTPERTAPTSHGLFGSITLDERSDATVCHVRGEVDVSLRAEAGAAMARIVQRKQPVVIDTSGVTFIDSSGLAFLIVVSQAVAREGVRVRLTGPPTQLLDLLELAGATDLFEITPGAEADDEASRPTASS